MILPVSLALLLFAMGAMGSAVDAGVQTEDLSSHFNSSHSINFVVDLLIKRLSMKLEREGKGTVHLEDFKRGFTSELFRITMKGGFQMTEGYAADLATLYRTGDAILEEADEDSIVSAHLGFHDLHFNYNYDTYFLEHHHNGTIYAEVGNNSVGLKFRVHHKPSELKPKCSITLIDFRVEQFDHINVKITNIGMFQNLKNKVNSWVADEVSRWFKEHVENMLRPRIAEIVDEIRLC